MNKADSKTHFFIVVKQVFVDHRILIGIIFITLLASLIRLYSLGDHSLWYDEAASVKNVRSILDGAKDDPWDLLSFTRRERVPPLFFLLLTPFYCLANTEWVLRLSSVIFGILSLPLMYLVCAQLANQNTGIVAALLLAFSPFHLYYSRELRPYSLFMFFALLAYALFHLALRERKGIYFLGLAVVVALGIYTHTYMVFVFLLLDFYFALNWKANRQLLAKWLLSHIAIGVLCLPALYLLIYHIQRGSVNLVDFPPGLRSLTGTLYLFTFGRVFFPSLSNLPLIIIQGVVWGFGLLAGVWSLWKKRTSKLGWQALTFVLSGFVIFLLIWLISISIKPLFDEARGNYLIFLLPVYVFTVAQGLSNRSSLELKMIMVSTALFICLASSFPYFFQWDQVGKGNFRSAAKYIQSNLEQNDVIVHTNYISTLPFGYYLKWEAQQVFVNSIEEIDYDKYNYFWLVVLKQTGGFQYSLNIFDQQGVTTQSHANKSSICSDSFSNPDFSLVNYANFPGKNDITVCLYHRVVS